MGGLGLLFARHRVATVFAEILFVGSAATCFWLVWGARPRSRKQQFVRLSMGLVLSVGTVFVITLPWTLIETHTSRAKLRVTSRDVVQMGVGQLVRVNIHLQNVGDATATNVYRADRVQFAHHGDEDAIFRKLHSELKADSDGLTIPVGGSVFFTVDGPLLERDDFIPRDAPPGSAPQVARDGAGLMVGVVIRYRDSDSATEDLLVETCFFVMNPVTLVLCRGHNVGDQSVPRHHRPSPPWPSTQAATATAEHTRGTKSLSQKSSRFTPESLRGSRRPRRLVVAERHRGPGPARRGLGEAHHRAEMVQPTDRRVARH